MRIPPVGEIKHGSIPHTVTLGHTKNLCFLIYVYFIIVEGWRINRRQEFSILNVYKMFCSSINQDRKVVIEKDLTEDKLHHCVQLLDSKRIKLSTDRSKWPKFKAWFKSMFQMYMPNINLDAFFRLTDMPTDVSDKLNFGSLLAISIKKYFSRDVYRFFENYTNLKFYFELNSDMNEITFLNQLALMDKMFGKCRNMEVVATRIGNAMQSLPEDLTFLTFCYHLPRREALQFYKFLKTSEGFDGYGPDVSEIYHKYYKYKADNPWGID